MITSFADEGTADIFDGLDSKKARKTCPQELWRIACRKLDMINTAAHVADLRIPPNNKLHALKGDRAGQHAIYINDQYRVCFKWTEAGAEHVQIVDYH
jgi:toxin HigB-1